MTRLIVALDRIVRGPVPLITVSVLVGFVAVGVWQARTAQRDWRRDQFVADQEEVVIRAEGAYVEVLKRRPDPVEFLASVPREYVDYKRNVRVLIDSLQIQKERAEREVTSLTLSTHFIEFRIRLAAAILLAAIGGAGISLVFWRRRRPRARA